ncbi:MAG: tRNA (adenosine(37)-N6)-threonylcarbamoyltransferase complex ATPase subunit type 1 TsaE [Planctomycetota bacterium]
MTDLPVIRWEYESRSVSDTERLGAALAEVWRDGTTVALCGTLGAGKTRLVQAIAAACDIDRSTVMSPTFVLCHEYHGRRSIYHLDAYRLRDDDEFLRLGVEEYFSQPVLTLVEWGDRVERVLPFDHWRIDIELAADDRRQITITAPASQSDVLAELRARLS